MPSLSRSFGKYLYDQLKTASAAPLLLVAQTGRLSWYGSYLYHNQHTHARAHATVPSTFCSERVSWFDETSRGYNSCIVFKHVKSDLDFACLYCCLAGLNEN